jgi:hypothetical protein
MGKILVRYYAFVKKEKGYVGQLELAQTTKIPSTKAPIIEDTPELVELFAESIEKITGKRPPRLT